MNLNQVKFLQNKHMWTQCNTNTLRMTLAISMSLEAQGQTGIRNLKSSDLKGGPSNSISRFLIFI